MSCPYIFASLSPDENAVKVLKELRMTHPHIPVVIITANSENTAPPKQNTGNTKGLGFCAGHDRSDPCGHGNPRRSVRGSFPTGDVPGRTPNPAPGTYPSIAGIPLPRPYDPTPATSVQADPDVLIDWLIRKKSR